MLGRCVAMAAASSVLCVFGAAENPLAVGEHGLWRLDLADGGSLSARDVETNGVAGAAVAKRQEGETLVTTWKSSVADVTVRAVTRGGVTDYTGEVTPHGQTALQLHLPATMRFPADSVKRFVYPGRGNSGLGVALNAKWFMPSPPDRPTAWQRVARGDAGYRHLYGNGIAGVWKGSDAVRIEVTDEGRKWLGPATVARLNGWKRPVIRASARKDCDVILVDSTNGPFFAGKSFGGKGKLWRFGVAESRAYGAKQPAECTLIRDFLPRLAAANPARRKIACIVLACGPRCGDYVTTTVREFRAAVKAGTPEDRDYVELTSPAEIAAALRSDEYLFVLNPYGESFPVDRPENYKVCLDAVKAFVRGGGHWTEVGGYSFYHALAGGGYRSYSVKYPPLFADFALLETTSGASAAVYGLQPRPPHEPWCNPKRFVPGETGVGGDRQGGWYDHAFALYAKAGTTWTSPTVRVRLGVTLEAALADYAQANTLTRPLADKVRDAQVLDKLVRAPLFLLAGKAEDKIAAVKTWPAPTTLHISDYLKGGFDKQYPDHLPPHPENFGTPGQLTELFAVAHAGGHLVSPYTNPTWWCDKPRGPSFEKWGEAPLCRRMDGRLYHECYGGRNEGFVNCYWHPGSQEANRRTVREFTETYPVDLLFQDQCGARTWMYDMNPASPDPTAWAEGMVSMNEEDSRKVPLATEDGWDQVANQQAALTGCTWMIVPLEHQPSVRPLMKERFPADTWEIEPVATRLFHGQTLFYMHDLACFVTCDRVLAWILGLGYNVTYCHQAKSYLRNPQSQAWYRWIQLLQDKVISRIATRRLTAFRHDRGPLLAAGGDLARETDDGVMTARYGEVTVAVNLGDVPRTVAGKRLAPYGWWIEGAGVKSGKLEGEDPFVEADGRRWEYVPDESGVVRPTEEEARTAPCARSGEKPQIGVIDMGPKYHPSWTKVSPAAWREALERSELSVRHGLRVVRLGSPSEVAAACAAGCRKWFAIVNPYGEQFPAERDRATEALTSIGGYVAHGGIWVETGGASFYYGIGERDGQVHRQGIFGEGAAALGFRIGTDDIDEPAVALKPTARAKAWFPEDLCARLAKTASPVNRETEKADISLVEDAVGRCWFGAVRAGGWGTLWRLGGAIPEPNAAKAVVTAALLHQWQTPPEPVPPSGRRCVKEVEK